jgi:hypothetical protein
MCPFAQPDGHDPPRLIDEPIPGLAAMLQQIVIGFEDAIGERVVADELPDIFHRVEFGRFWRQGDDGDVGWNDELPRQMPAGLIEQ